MRNNNNYWELKKENYVGSDNRYSNYLKHNKKS